MTIKFEVDQIKLLELFISKTYFAAMRDEWERMINHVEACLSSYMSNLSPNYRSKPLQDQPDVAWGHRVLPNFRQTMEGLNTGFILLTHGDMSGLAYANGVRSDYKGQMEYGSDWMEPDDAQKYDDAIYSAMVMAHNIGITEAAEWTSLKPSKHLKELQLASQQASFRSYKVNMNVSVRSGNKITVNGIYVPDLEQGCPQFLNSGRLFSPKTSVYVRSKDLLDPITGEKYDEHRFYEEKDCIWYLIERCDGAESTTDSVHAATTLCINGGEQCSQSGYYFTPASPNSRSWFEAGSLMPLLSTEYGMTIWQWDLNQK